MNKTYRGLLAIALTAVSFSGVCIAGKKKTKKSVVKKKTNSQFLADDVINQLIRSYKWQENSKGAKNILESNLKASKALRDLFKKYPDFAGDFYAFTADVQDNANLIIANPGYFDFCLNRLKDASSIPKTMLPETVKNISSSEKNYSEFVGRGYRSKPVVKDTFVYKGGLVDLSDVKKHPVLAKQYGTKDKYEKFVKEQAKQLKKYKKAMQLKNKQLKNKKNRKKVTKKNIRRQNFGGQGNFTQGGRDLNSHEQFMNTIYPGDDNNMNSFNNDQPNNNDDLFATNGGDIPFEKEEEIVKYNYNGFQKNNNDDQLTTNGDDKPEVVEPKISKSSGAVCDFWDFNKENKRKRKRIKGQNVRNKVDKHEIKIDNAAPLTEDEFRKRAELNELKTNLREYLDETLSIDGEVNNTPSETCLEDEDKLSFV